MNNDTNETEHGAAAECAAAEDFAGRLSDAELAARGFKKIQAFARTATAGDGSAARSKRAREKAKVLGVSQLNIVAPECAHAALKAMAKRLQAGETLAQVMRSTLAEEAKCSGVAVLGNVGEAKVCEPLTRTIASLKGWRRLVARLLGIL